MYLDGLHAAPTPAQRAAATRKRIIAAQRARLAAAQKAKVARQRIINQQRARLRAQAGQSAPDEYDPVVTALPSPVPGKIDWSGADFGEDMSRTQVMPADGSSADALKTDWFWEDDDEAAPADSGTDTGADTGVDTGSAPGSSSRAGLLLAAAVAALIYFRPIY